MAWNLPILPQKDIPCSGNTFAYVVGMPEEMTKTHEQTSEASSMPRAHHTLQSLKAADVMTRHPMTVDRTDTVQDAADAMVAADVRHLPVVSQRTLMGIISDRDLR